MVKILEKIRKFSKEESGASMVMVVLSLVVIFGFTAFAVDFGNAYTTKVSMQDACDLSALAAANSLPERAKTESVAKEYAELNGYEAKNVTVNILNNGEQVEVKIKKDVKTYFAGVVGYSEMPVSCKAVAAAGEKGAKDYAIFSGTKAYFGLHGSVNIPDGDIHANGAADISGTLNIDNGVIEVPKFNNKGSSGNYETYEDEDNYIEMPNYEDIINERIPYVEDSEYQVIDGNFPDTQFAKSHTHNGVLTIESEEKIYANSHLNIGEYNGIKKLVIKGILKVNGMGIGSELVVEGSLFSEGYLGIQGKADISGVMMCKAGIVFANDVVLSGATIVADGQEINFANGKQVVDNSVDGKYSAVWGRGNTHINLNSDKMDVKALFYSPNGECIMSGKEVTVKGSITANQVGTNNGTLTVELPKNDPNWPFGGRTQSGKAKKSAKLVE